MNGAQTALATLGAEIAALQTDVKNRGVGIDSPQFKAWLHGDTLADPALAVSTTTAWAQSPVVRKGINILCRSAGWLPLVVGRQSSPRDATIIKNHWLPALLKRPNPFLTQYQLLAFTVAHLSIFGECFWWMYKRDNRERPTELWLLDPRFVMPRFDNRSDDMWPIVNWDLVINGRRRATVLSEDLVHFKYENPFSPWRGDPPLASAGLAIGADIEMSKYNLSFFKRGAKIAGVLYTEGDRSIRTPTQADEVRAHFMSRYLNPHQVAVLYGGLRFKEVAQTHTDSSFIEGKKLNREEILMSLGVPAVVAGLLDGATYANAHEQMRTFWLITMLPLLQLLADAIEQRMLYREPDNKAWFDTSNVEALRESYDQKSQTAMRFFSMGMPYNRIIDLMQLPVPHEAWGNEGLVGFTLTPARILIEAAEASANEPDEDPQAPPPDDDDATNTEPEDDDEDESVANVNALGVKADRQIARALRGLTRAQALIPAPVMQVATPPGPVRDVVVSINGTVVPPIAGRDVTDEVIADILLVISKDADRLSAISRQYFDKFFHMGGMQAGDMLGLEFDISDYPEAVDFINTLTGKVKGVNDTTQKHIRDTLRDGINAGETPQELADRVRAVYNFTGYRSKTIARTYASTTVNGARHIVMEHEGVERREWMTAGDERVRETHERENGHIVGLDERYPVTGLRYPGDPDGEPQEIIRCRCLELPVLNEEDDERSARLRAIMKSKESRDFYWNVIVRQYGTVERTYASALRGFFNRQRKAVLAALDKVTA